MDKNLIGRLRRNQNLRTFADGREAVDVTVQYLGDLPARSRPERKEWLQRHFDHLNEEVGSQNMPLELLSGSLSVSAQTIRAIVPVNELDVVEDVLAASNHRIAIDAAQRLTDPDQ